MMRYTALMSAVGACVLIWHECGENPAFFCYRIGMGAFTGIRSRALQFAPIVNSTTRNNFACLNHSGISSTPSTMSKD
jgi:hypothetical protein